MTDIMITASQINEMLLNSELAEGKDNLQKYCDFFHCLEGKPIIERLSDGILD